MVRQRNAISMAFRRRDDDGPRLVVYPLSSATENNNNNNNVVRAEPPSLPNLSGLPHVHRPQVNVRHL